MPLRFAVRVVRASCKPKEPKVYEEEELKRVRKIRVSSPSRRVKFKLDK